MQDVAPYGMVKRLNHFISVDLHGRHCLFAIALSPYRDAANLISVTDDMQIVRADSHHHAC